MENVDIEIVMIGPQFEREDGLTVAAPSCSFEELREKSAEDLLQMGCGVWDEPDENGKVLMLFPKEWYSLIPAGYSVEVISGETESFQPDITDNDYRFGCLAYGVRVSKSAA